MRLGNKLFGSLALNAIVCLALTTSASAEDPIATDLDVSEVPDYVGVWILNLDIMGRKMELFLTIADLDGKVGATLDSTRSPEPLAIAEIGLLEEGDGLLMASELKFGSFAISVEIEAHLEAGQLNGTIRESSSELFKADFIGTRHTGDDDLVQGKRPSPTEARFRLPEGKLIRITFSPLTTEDEDFSGLEKLEAGEVFGYTGGRATKLLTDVDLKFGDTIVKKENVAPNYPGVYSVWLKKTDAGWSLVFNDLADVWGTSYDDASDSAEVPLRLVESDEEHEKFLVTIDKEDELSGVINVFWGKSQWSASFSAVQ